MRYLKSFSNLNESYNLKSEFYELFGDIIYVTNVFKHGNDEYRVEYLTSDNKDSAYIGTDKDIEEDFIQTDKSFKVKSKKPIKTKSKNKGEHKTYDLVFYMGKRKIETIKHNVSIQLANGLKKLYSSFPNYVQGELKVIPNKKTL